MLWQDCNTTSPMFPNNTTPYSEHLSFNNSVIIQIYIYYFQMPFRCLIKKCCGSTNCARWQKRTLVFVSTEIVWFSKAVHSVPSNLHHLCELHFTFRCLIKLVTLWVAFISTCKHCTWLWPWVSSYFHPHCSSRNMGYGTMRVSQHEQ